MQPQAPNDLIISLNAAAIDPLEEKTPEGWAEIALSDLNQFLRDHASCERKAASQAMSILAKYPEYGLLVEPLVSLAREELEHFVAVCRILAQRGVSLDHDEPDPYVIGLRQAMRHSREGRLQDSLIVSGLVEARSHERLVLVAEALTSKEPELARFYAQLARVEAGHFKVFLKLSERLFGLQDTKLALHRLAKHEAQVMKSQPFRVAVH